MKKSLFNTPKKRNEKTVETKYDKEDSQKLKEAILKYKKENKKP